MQKESLELQRELGLPSPTLGAGQYQPLPDSLGGWPAQAAPSCVGAKARLSGHSSDSTEWRGAPEVHGVKLKFTRNTWGWDTGTQAHES